LTNGGISLMQRIYPHPSERIHSFFFANSSNIRGWVLCSLPGVPMLLHDAEPSREERGHRGVRPRHPRAD